MTSVPLVEPGAAGANTTLTVVLSPAPIVTGTDNPFMLKPLPVAEAPDMVTLKLPVFASVTEIV
jgi:hypothetical protein